MIRHDTLSRSLLIKPVAGDCNLHCAYCFYHERPSDPYAQASRHRMKPEVLTALIQQGLRLDRRQASFGWQGGEPTLAGLEFFQQAVELEQRYGFKGQAVSNGLQTNGLLLDAAWARFLRQYSFLVGLSLDGPAPYHDLYRTFANGSPTQSRVLDVMRLLRQERVEFNILAVVNRTTADHAAEIYDYLLSQGVTFMQFIPCVERDPVTGRTTDFSVTPEQYGDFLAALFDRWYHGGQPDASVRDFEAILAVYLGQEAPVCTYQERCGNYLVVEHNGDVYPCDFEVDAAHYLGNLLETPLEELFQSAKLLQFAAAKGVPHPECQVCSWLPFCHQGCPRFRRAEGERSYLCRAYQRFFAHSHPGFLALRERILREQGVSPAAWPRLPVSPFGRNDPCPCGSGKKFKVCCARRSAPREEGTP